MWYRIWASAPLGLLAACTLNLTIPERDSLPPDHGQPAFADSRAGRDHAADHAPVDGPRADRVADGAKDAPAADKGAKADQRQDAGGTADLAPCSPLDCKRSNNTTGSAPCTTTAQTLCAPATWLYCQCGAGSVAGRLFLHPPASVKSSKRHAILVGEGLSDVRLAIDASCPGGSGANCPFVASTICGTQLPSATVYVWEVTTWATPGPHTLTVWINDAGAPCWADDGGQVLMTMGFTAP